MNFRVGDRNEDALDTTSLGLSGGLAGERNNRLAEFVVEHLHVAPGNLASPSRTDGFENGFLGGEPTGDVRNRILLAGNVLLLAVGKDAIEKYLAVAFDGTTDAIALDDVDTMSHDGHAYRLRQYARRGKTTGGGVFDRPERVC